MLSLLDKEDELVSGSLLVQTDDPGIQLQCYLNTYIKFLVYFVFNNYSNPDPSLQNKRNSSQQSKSSREFSLFKLQALVKLSFFYNNIRLF